jgi:hypothetical protein
MNQTGIVLALFLVHCGICLGQQPAAKLQSLPLSEVSGAVNIGDDRLLLIGDEGYQVQLVTSARAAFETATFKDRLKPLFPATNGSKESKKVMDDIEDVAWDPARSAAFAITSHSRSKKQDKVADPRGEKPERHRLARLVLKNGAVEPPQELGVLEDALKRIPFVAEGMKRPHQAGGGQGTFNIEGLVFEPAKGRLLIGLRSPTLDHHGKPAAVVLALKNPHALFDSPQVKAPLDLETIPLDLEGAGIRGMTWDPERQGVWIVAGRSADPDMPADHVLSTVWFWDPNHPDRPLRKAPLDLGSLESLESVCVLDRNGKHGLLLISDDGGGSTKSRYLWVPTPETVGP